MVLPSSTNKVIYGSLLPTLPPRGRDLQPRESILLPLPTLKESEFFNLRRFTSEGEIVAPLTEGPPWALSVQGACDAVQKIRITNNSTSTRTLFPSSKLGSICSTLPPIQKDTYHHQQRLATVKRVVFTTKLNLTRNSNNLNPNYKVQC